MNIRYYTHQAVTVISILLIGVIIGWWFSPRGEPPHSQSIPACATEDSIDPCYWDATQQGNGEGHDVLNGYVLLHCQPRTYLVIPGPYWDEGCQRWTKGRYAVDNDPTAILLRTKAALS